MFRNLLIKAALNNQNSDLSEVYTYAAQFNITPQQVNAVLADKPAIIREKLIAWKYLIHSLFDTGYTPWIKGDGVAYFIVPIKPNANSYAEAVTRVASAGTYLLLGARIDMSDNNRQTRHTLTCTSTRIRLDWTLHNTATHEVNTLSKHKIKVTTGYLAIDDVVVINRNDIVSVLPDVEFAVFTCNEANGATTSYQYNGYFNRVIITGDIASNVNGSVNLVPYLDNGECGMLDLVSGNFYGSAVQNGLFTYILEDSNGNSVNLN